MKERHRSGEYAEHVDVVALLGGPCRPPTGSASLALQRNGKPEARDSPPPMSIGPVWVPVQTISTAVVVPSWARLGRSTPGGMTHVEPGAWTLEPSSEPGRIEDRLQQPNAGHGQSLMKIVVPADWLTSTNERRGP